MVPSRISRRRRVLPGSFPAKIKPSSAKAIAQAATPGSAQARASTLFASSFSSLAKTAPDGSFRSISFFFGTCACSAGFSETFGAGSGWVWKRSASSPALIEIAAWDGSATAASRPAGNALASATTLLASGFSSFAGAKAGRSSRAVSAFSWICGCSAGFSEAFGATPAPVCKRLASSSALIENVVSNVSAITVTSWSSRNLRVVVGRFLRISSNGNEIGVSPGSTLRSGR